jgi:hypothetical protein
MVHDDAEERTEGLLGAAGRRVGHDDSLLGSGEG